MVHFILLASIVEDFICDLLRFYSISFTFCGKEEKIHSKTSSSLNSEDFLVMCTHYSVDVLNDEPKICQNNTEELIDKKGKVYHGPRNHEALWSVSLYRKFGSKLNPKKNLYKCCLRLQVHNLQSNLFITDHDFCPETYLDFRNQYHHPATVRRKLLLLNYLYSNSSFLEIHGVLDNLYPSQFLQIDKFLANQLILKGKTNVGKLDQRLKAKTKKEKSSFSKGDVHLTTRKLTSKYFSKHLVISRVASKKKIKEPLSSLSGFDNIKQSNSDDDYALIPKNSKSFWNFSHCPVHKPLQILDRNDIFQIRSHLNKRLTFPSLFCLRRPLSIAVFPVQYAPLHRLMRHEMLRIQSFDKCSSNKLSASQLAHDGFYLSGPDGQVTCFSCERTHKHFLNGLELENAHEHHCECERSSINVPVFHGTGDLTSSEIEIFLTFYKGSESWDSGIGLPSSDTPLPDGASASYSKVREASDGDGQDIVCYMLTSATKTNPIKYDPYSVAWGTSYQNSVSSDGATGGRRDQMGFLDLRGAAYPLFANRKFRRDSFVSWDPNHVQKPDDLVNLGFFYAGYSDCARCFYCGLGLKYWRPTDDAAYQHARFRPLCLYNSFVKGQDFVDEVQRSIAQDQQNQATRTASEVERDNFRVPNLDELMRSDAAAQVIGDGWSRDQVQEGLVKLVQDLGEECLVYGILTDVMATQFNRLPPRSAADQQRQRRNSVNQHDAEVLQTIDTVAESRTTEEPRVENDSQGSSTAMAQPLEVSLSPDVVIRLLEREHNYLKKRLQCLVCGENKIGCIYLPCGHVVACQACGDLASTCARCNKVISATANTYMS